MQLLRFDIFQPYPHVQAFVTTRRGGVSQSPFDNSNLSYAVADQPDHVTQNRLLLAETLGISLSRCCIPQQTHSATIHVITPADIGKGSSPDAPTIPSTDGLVTDLRETCLMVFSADCVLTLLYDTQRHIIGATHGGWRGTAQRIAAKAVQTMQRHFGSHPDDIRVGIAPAIRACCYEVGEDVSTVFRQTFSYADQCLHWRADSQKYHVDLHHATRLQLEEVGVRPSHIEVKEICTYCHADTFFSSRHGRGITGRFAAGIFLSQAKKEIA